MENYCPTFHQLNFRFSTDHEGLSSRDNKKEVFHLTKGF